MRAKLPTAGRPADLARTEALERGRIAIQANRPIEAERIATEILKTNSGHREAIKILGYALVMLGRAEEALAPLEKAARGSHDSELETQLAAALQRCGRTEDAIVWLKRAIKRKLPRAAAFYELGLILVSVHRYSEAIDVLARGTEAAPMMVDMIVQLGHAHSRLNERPKAAACFRRALAMNPAHPDANAALGDVLMKDRNFEQAAQIYRQLVAADSANADARLRLGDCLLNLGDTESAFACLRAAAGRDPKLYGKTLRALAASSRGRFWLRPSDAAKFLRGEPRGR